MDIRLTSEEIKELRRIQKKEKFHRQRFIKATVLLMLHRGLPIEEICASLSLDDNTTYRYAEAFRETVSTIHFLENIKDCKEEVRALLTLNFRTVGNTSVYFPKPFR